MYCEKMGMKSSERGVSETGSFAPVVCLCSGNSPGTLSSLLVLPVFIDSYSILLVSSYFRLYWYVIIFIVLKIPYYSPKALGRNSIGRNTYYNPYFQDP